MSGRAFIVLLVAAAIVPASAAGSARTSGRPIVSEAPRISGAALAAAEVARNPGLFTRSHQAGAVSTQPGALDVPNTLAPSLGGSWDTINFDEQAAANPHGSYFIPPDPNGASGPNQVVDIVNSAIEWYSKAGVFQGRQSLVGFFGPLSPQADPFDPKVIYDRASNRWLVVALEFTDTALGDTASTSRILLAASDDSDPNGTWFESAINSDLTIGGKSAWADFPGIAVNGNAIFVTANMFRFFGDGGTGVGERLFVIDKTSLYAGGSASANVYDPFALAPGSVGPLTLQPAEIIGTGPSGVGTYLVGYDGLNDRTSTFLEVIKVANPLGTPTFTASFVQWGSVGAGDNLSTGLPDAPQTGTTRTLDSGDRRVSQTPIVRDGKLYLAAETVPGSGVNSGQATARWWALNTSDLSLSDTGVVGGEDIAPGTYTLYPSVAVNAADEIGISFAATGPTIHPGSYYTVHRPSDAAGTVEPAGTLRAGTDYYVRTFEDNNTSPSRWGDFTGISVDPSNDSTFWIFNQSAIARGTTGVGGCPFACVEDGRWGTAFGKFTPPRSLTVARNGSGSGSVTSTPTGIDCGSTCSAEFAFGSAVTLTPTAAAGSTFSGWSGACTGTGACVVTIDDAKSVTATFNLVKRTLTVSKAGTGTGSVSSSPTGIDCGSTCSADFDQGTVVTLTATAGANSTFVGWSGACTGTGSCSVTMDAAKSVTATFNLVKRTLTVSKAGSGTGSVTSSPAGIDCGSTCSADFDHGTVVTLTATAGANSTFAGWSGACTGTGSCSVTMDAAKSVTATFNLVKRTLTVSKAGSGTGSVTSSPPGIDCGSTCSADFDHGTVVTLTATPALGSTFTGWSGACTGSGSCVVTMDAATSVTATFDLPVGVELLTVTKSGNGSGTVTSSPAGIDCGTTCSANFVDGTVVTLTASAGANSTFTGWGGACSGTGSCVVTMSVARSVSATFSLVKRTLTVAKAGTGSGTVTSSPAGIDCGSTCSADFDHGTVVSLTATAAANSTFAGWSGACTGTGSCSVTMDAAKSVTATFNIAGRTLTVSKAGTGAGTVTSSPAGIDCGSTCSADFDHGTVVTLTATAGANSTFGGWSGACTGTGSCSVTMDAAKSVTATFDLVKRTLTVAKAGTGSGTVTSSPEGIDCGSTCSADFDHGTVVTLTPSPASNSAFAGWNGACTGTGSCTVTMDVAKSVTATFNIARRTLTLSKAGSGAGTVTSSPAGIDCGSTCSADFDHGTVVTLTATVGANSTFGGWSGACTGTGSCSLTMDAAKSVTATFDLVKRTLTVGKSGTGSGTVTSSPGGINCGSSCSFDFDFGTLVTLTATPDSSSSFSGWSGGCTGSGSCTVTMDAARGVSASFTANPAPPPPPPAPVAPRFALTVATTGAGSGTVTSSPTGITCGASCTATYDSGTVVTLSAAAAVGSTFTGWTGACSGTGSCSVTMDSAKSVTATFGLVGTLAPPGCVVPKLLGLRLAAARSALAKAHCRLGKVTHVAAPTRLRGRVVSQRPRRGTKLKSGAKVAIALGRAPRR